MARRPVVPEELTRGPFTITEAQSAGLSRKQLRGASWKRVPGGLYAWTGLADNPALILSALHRRLPDGAVFSGQTAGWLHGLDVPPADPVEVTVPYACGVSARAGVRIRHGILSTQDIAGREGVPVTSPLRTAFDLARHLCLVEAVVAVDRALHSRLTDLAKFRGYVATNPGLTWISQARRVADVAEPATESAMETSLIPCVRPAGVSDFPHIFSHSTGGLRQAPDRVANWRRLVSVWHAMWLDPDRLGGFSLDSAMLRRAWRFAQPYRGRLLGYLLITTAGGVLQVLPAFVIRRIVDEALPAHSAAQVALLAIALGLLFMANSALHVAAAWSGLRIGSGIVLSLRRALYDHLQRMPLAFFTRAQSGQVQTRLNYDVNTVENLLTETMSSAVNDVVSLSFTLVAMIALSWQIAAVVLLLVPAVLVPAELVGRRMRRLSKERMKRWGDLNVAVAERLNVAGALVVKLFGHLDAELDAFTHRARLLRTTAVNQQVLAIAFGAGLSLAGSLAVVAIYWAGGLAVLSGSLSLGTLIALATLAQRVYAPVVDLASVRINLASGLVGFERVFEVLDKPLAIADRPSARELAVVRGRVEFEDVWFRYPPPAQVSIATLESRDEAAPALSHEPSAWVLKGLSFTAKPGTMTALVGPTGAGKTTICHLVPRLYDVSRGAVKVDGHDVRDVTLESLSRSLAMVPQDPHLFHDTVIANLRYARPDASDEEVAGACRAARIHDLIERLPDGYETMVGERGYRFSGGEKQRLAIARALLKGPSILILDEATSHLDSETELLVQEALAVLLAGRTSFVIAHRLSTIRQADQILVVDAGRLVDRGTHEELLAGGGLYADLHATQFSAASSHPN